IDLVAGWFSTTVRYVITLTSLSMATVAFIAWTVMPLARRPTLATAARDVDQAIPQLEERWSTVTELSQNTDAPEVRGSEAMISKVASEAARAGESVDPSAIVPVAPVLRAGRWLAGVTAVLTLFFVLYFDHAAVLLQRFWMPGANISLTRVSASPADTWVPM